VVAIGTFGDTGPFNRMRRPHQVAEHIFVNVAERAGICGNVLQVDPDYVR